MSSINFCRCQVTYTKKTDNNISTHNLHIRNKFKSKYRKYVNEFCPLTVETATFLPPERVNKMNTLIQSSIGKKFPITIYEGRAELFSDGKNVHYLINQDPKALSKNFVSFDIKL